MYRIVTARFLGMAPSGKAFFVDVPRHGKAAIPLSLIHAADETKLCAASPGDEVTFRLRVWKAEEVGLS